MTTPGVPTPVTFEPQAIETDAAFGSIAATGEVVPSVTDRSTEVAAFVTKLSKRRMSGSVPLPASNLTQFDPDLDDQVSF
jgi:hypothetical protein